MGEGESRPAGTADWFRPPAGRWLAGVVLIIVLYAAGGFWLVPWLLKRELPAIARDTLGRELELAEAAFNPFLLTLRLGGLQLRETGGGPLFGLQELFVDFELGSLFRRAWTFREVRIVAPTVQVVRGKNGEINLSRLVPPEPAAGPAPPEPLPRVIVQHLELRQGRIDFEDQVPATPFATQIGPLEVTLEALSTLPNQAGRQAFEVTTETGARLAWSGTLGLDPLLSEGEVTLQGPHVPVVYRYLQDTLNFELQGGEVDVAARYRIAGTPDGGVAVAVDDLAWSLSNATFIDRQSSAEFLRIPKLAISGGRLRWPEQEASAARILAEGLRINATLEPDGSVDIERLLTPREPAGDAPPAGQAAAEPPWRISVAEIAVQDLAAEITDRTLPTPATLGIADFDLTLRNVSNADGARFDLESRLSLAGGGTLRLDGGLVALPAVAFAGKVHVEDVNLAQAQPYVSESLRVQVRSGALGLDGDIRSGEKEQLAFDGRVNIAALDLHDEIKNEKLAGFDRLSLDGAKFSLGERRLSIARAGLTKPYARVFIAEDQSTNIGALVVASPAADQSLPSTEPAQPPFAVRVGRITIKDGSSDFTDLSLPLPFAAHIIGLKGEMSVIDSTSAAPSRIAVEGQVNEYGYTRIEGEVSAVDPMDNTDIRVIFRNVEMAPLSPYTVKFAGHKIARGKLDLDLRYRFDQKRMNGDNKIVIDELELGEKVPHPDAVDLPLGLAIALLKDANGRIDLDMPVSGSVDDPEFGIGRVIWKALVTLITKAVTAPFRLLGSLIGLESDDLGEVGFAPGRADLLPPEREKLANVAAALARRPDLRLVVPAVANPEADGSALQRTQLAAAIDQALAAGGERNVEARTRKVVEQLYVGAFPQAALEPLQERFTVPPADAPAAKPRLDELAYLEEMRRQLVGAQPVDPAAIEALASARAAAIRDALVGAGGVAPERITLGARKDVSLKDESDVVAELEVSADGG